MPRSELAGKQGKKQKKGSAEKSSGKKGQVSILLV
jgi:hypothetical protein